MQCLQRFYFIVFAFLKLFYKTGSKKERKRRKKEKKEEDLLYIF